MRRTRGLGRHLARRSQSAYRPFRIPDVGRSATASWDREGNSAAASDLDSGRSTSSSMQVPEQQVLGSLRRILPGSTIIVISHRLSAMRMRRKSDPSGSRACRRGWQSRGTSKGGGAYSRLFKAVASAPEHDPTILRR